MPYLVKSSLVKVILDNMDSVQWVSSTLTNGVYVGGSSGIHAEDGGGGGGGHGGHIWFLRSPGLLT